MGNQKKQSLRHGKPCPPPAALGRLKGSSYICGSRATDANGGLFGEPIGTACKKYYENGKLATTDATAAYEGTDVDKVGKDKLLQDCTDLLNEAFDGLNTVYGAKGYPIK